MQITFSNCLLNKHSITNWVTKNFILIKLLLSSDRLFFFCFLMFDQLKAAEFIIISWSMLNFVKKKVKTS